MKKWKVIALWVLGLAGTLLVLGIYLSERNIRRMNFDPLSNLVEARLAELVTFPAVASSVSTESQAKLFATYMNASRTGAAAIEMRHDKSLPETSIELQNVEPASRLDAWGHPFCLAILGNRVAVVSAGPKAIGSFTCKELAVDLNGASNFITGKLYSFSSGVLVLLVQ